MEHQEAFSRNEEDRHRCSNTAAGGRRRSGQPSPWFLVEQKASRHAKASCREQELEENIAILSHKNSRELLEVEKGSGQPSPWLFAAEKEVGSHRHSYLQRKKK